MIVQSSVCYHKMWKSEVNDPLCQSGGSLQAWRMSTQVPSYSINAMLTRLSYPALNFTANPCTSTNSTSLYKQITIYHQQSLAKRHWCYLQYAHASLQTLEFVHFDDILHHHSGQHFGTNRHIAQLRYFHQPLLHWFQIMFRLIFLCSSKALYKFNGHRS